MANQLDELNGPVLEDGRDVNVIAKRITMEVGTGSLVFEIMLWVLGIIPGLIFLIMKVSARNYLDRLQQKIQSDASTIDNYLVQRGEILKNVVGIVNKAVDLDKDTMKSIAAYRGGVKPGDDTRNDVVQELDTINNKINVAFESYPELRAHAALEDAMQQNSYLQKVISAARETYNDSVRRWNQDIQTWPTKKIVAAKMGYSTMIPFAASKAEKDLAKSTFF